MITEQTDDELRASIVAAKAELARREALKTPEPLDPLHWFLVERHRFDYGPTPWDQASNRLPSVVKANDLLDEIKAFQADGWFGEYRILEINATVVAHSS